MVPQDLHIHTVFSTGDSAIVREQTPEFIFKIRHAQVIGISDHFEYIVDPDIFNIYEKELRRYGFYVGTEISGFSLISKAIKTNCDYFVYHCSEDKDYKAVELLLDTKKPVIIAHPPGWLNQNVARYVCRELGIRETILFPDKTEKIILMRKSGLN